jgi:hypothetical protein
MESVGVVGKGFFISFRKALPQDLHALHVKALVTNAA